MQASLNPGQYYYSVTLLVRMARQVQSRRFLKPTRGCLKKISASKFLTQARGIMASTLRVSFSKRVAIRMLFDLIKEELNGIALAIGRSVIQSGQACSGATMYLK